MDKMNQGMLHSHDCGEAEEELWGRGVPEHREAVVTDATGLQLWRDGTALLKAEPRVCVRCGLLFYSDLELKPSSERRWGPAPMEAEQGSHCSPCLRELQRLEPSHSSQTHPFKTASFKGQP